MADDLLSGYRNPTQLPGGQQIQTFGAGGGQGYDGSGINPNSGRGVWNYAGAAEGQPGSTGATNPAGVASDPFGYTMGSLLTPWTRTFQPPTSAPSSGGGGGGPAPAAAPGFNFGTVGYNYRDPGAYQAGAAFQGPAAFSGTRVADAPTFQGGQDYRYDPYAAGSFNLQDMMHGQTRPEFSGPGALTVDRFGGGAAFQAPTGTDDPSFQFRRQQGQEALETAAAMRGNRGGDVMKALVDYGQQAGSQEYAASYGRAFDLWNAQNSMALNTYDRNANAGVLENQTAYGRASDAYGRGNDAYLQDANLGLAAFGANEQSRQFAQGTNAQYGLAANESAYNRRASEYDRTTQNTRAANEANYARNQGEYQQNFTNSRDVYQMNEGNRLNAYQADSASAAAMGNLGMNATFGAYDRNFQNYATGFNIDEQRRQQAAAQAAQGAGNARADEQLAYNRALQQYGMEYDQFNANQDRQFSRLYSMTALGQNAAGMQGSFGGQYAGAFNEGGYGGANAQAAGVMGAGNAYAQMGSNIGNGISQGIGMGMYYGGGQQQPAQRNAPYGGGYI